MHPNNPFAGLIVPLVTPFDARGDIDLPAVRRLVDHVLRVDVAALMVGGTTGEVMALAAPERIQLIEAVCAAAAGRTRVIAGVGSTSPHDTLDFARTAAAAGADALSLQPPSYFPMNDRDVLGYFRTMLDGFELPLILYNIPGFTHNTLSVDVAVQLKADPRVIGIKDSTSDPAYFTQLMARCAAPDFFVNCGDEARIAKAVLAGACGCTASLANIEPELCQRCIQAAAQGDAESALALQQQIVRIIAPFRAQGWIFMIRWIKARLAESGVCLPRVSDLFEHSEASSAPEVVARG